MPVLPVTHTLRVMPSLGQVIGGLLSRREMQRGQARGEDSIQFLGKGLAQIAGAQSGFDVGHGNAAIKGGQRAAESRRRVALDDGQIGLGRQKTGSSALMIRAVDCNSDCPGCMTSRS